MTDHINSKIKGKFHHAKVVHTLGKTVWVDPMVGIEWQHWEVLVYLHVVQDYSTKLVISVFGSVVCTVKSVLQFVTFHWKNGTWILQDGLLISKSS